MAFPRPEHDVVLAKPYGLFVAINRGMIDRQERHQQSGPTYSSVQTLKLSSVLGPNVVVMATSEASRPRAIRIRPIRGTLLRGSNICQAPTPSTVSQTSNQAAKSP